MSVTAKTLSLVLAGTFGLTAAVYSGGDYLNDIKGNYSKLQEKIVLTADEAKTKIDSANGLVQTLEKAFEDQKAETTKANTEITTAKTEMGKANQAIADANADMSAVKTFGDGVVSATSGDQVTVNVTSTYEVVSGQSLAIANVAGTTKKRVVNPNSAAVNVSVNNTTVSLAGGDVLYVDQGATVVQQ